MKKLMSTHVTVDGRKLYAQACDSSGIGRVDGLAVVAASVPDVLGLMNALPGRILVLTGDAVSAEAASAVETAVAHQTFTAVVVNGSASPFSGLDLAVPVVVVDSGEAWTPHRVSRLLVEVDEVVADVTTPRKVAKSVAR